MITRSCRVERQVNLLGHRASKCSKLPKNMTMKGSYDYQTTQRRVVSLPDLKVGNGKYDYQAIPESGRKGSQPNLKLYLSTESKLLNKAKRSLIVSENTVLCSTFYFKVFYKHRLSPATPGQLKLIYFPKDLCCSEILFHLVKNCV